MLSLGFCVWFSWFPNNPFSAPWLQHPWRCGGDLGQWPTSGHKCTKWMQFLNCCETEPISRPREEFHLRCNTRCCAKQPMSTKIVSPCTDCLKCKQNARLQQGHKSKSYENTHLLSCPVFHMHTNQFTCACKTFWEFPKIKYWEVHLRDIQERTRHLHKWWDHFCGYTACVRSRLYSCLCVDMKKLLID